jgi:uncharacterized membrane protein
METNDNTLLEMQQQMQQLRNKLDSQKIVNDRLFQSVYRQGLDKLKVKNRLTIIVGICAMLSFPVLTMYGVSIPVIIAFEMLLLVCVVAEILTMRHIPNPGRDLVTATRELSKYRKIYLEWFKYSLPVLGILLVWLCVDVFRNPEVEETLKYFFLGGVGAGTVIGVTLGLMQRRKIIDEADNLLDQIKNLEEE